VKRQILIASLLALTVAGCGQVKQVASKVSGGASAPSQQIRSDGPITLSGGGAPRLQSPTPIEQSAPRTQNWRSDLPRNIPYFNMTDGGVTIYGEAERTTVTATLLPGEGGYIQTCDDSKPVCKMSFGNGREGWVAMGSMAGVSN
jgi:hypothetical protein